MSSKPPARDRVRRSRATAAARAIGAGVAAGLGEEAMSNPLGFDSPVRRSHRPVLRRAGSVQCSGRGATPPPVQRVDLSRALSEDARALVARAVEQAAAWGSPDERRNTRPCKTGRRACTQPSGLSTVVYPVFTEGVRP